jgi:hypothetical protein
MNDVGKRILGGIMKNYLLAGFACAQLGLFFPSSAAANDFWRCDGYEPAQGKIGGDGMSTKDGFLGIGRSNSDIRKSEYSIGAAGVAACDQALNNPDLLDEYWLRRAHLLQAKAVHQIGAKDYEGALVSLAASDAVGASRNDRNFDDSVKLSNRAVRAFALLETGKKAEAEQEVACSPALPPRRGSRPTRCRACSMIMN